MHDDRELLEERITRELTERVLPLVHPQRVALTVEAGPTLDDLVPFAVGQRWGPPWGTTWFRFTGAVNAMIGRCPPSVSSRTRTARTTWKPSNSGM